MQSGYLGIALNGTQWLYGTIFVASTLVTGLLHPGFLWPQGRIHPTVTKITNLCFLQAHSVFHQYDDLAAILIPSIGLEKILGHIEAFIKFPQQLQVMVGKAWFY